jgi:hypothetical protein
MIMMSAFFFVPRFGLPVFPARPGVLSPLAVVLRTGVSA